MNKPSSASVFLVLAVLFVTVFPAFAFVTREIRTGPGQALTDPQGRPLANVAVSFQLVDPAGHAADGWDVATGERIAPAPVTARTNAFGQFSTALWPTSRGSESRYYQCKVNVPGVQPFLAPLDDGSGPLSWISFKAQNGILTPIGKTILSNHIDNAVIHVTQTDRDRWDGERGGSGINGATAPLSYDSGTQIISLPSVPWSILIGVPSFFSGAYADLTGKPALFSGAYADLTGLPIFFSGSYPDLTDKPTIPAQLTLAEQYARELASSPRRVYFVYGASTDGGTTPDATTQTSMDALIANGVPEANIRWMYEDDASAGSFTVANLSSGSTVDGIVLSQHGGVFTVADAVAASTVDNVVITSGDVLVFTVADATAVSAIDNVVLALSGGLLSVGDLTSASTSEGVVLVQHGGVFVLADMTSASTIDNVVITTGASDNFDVSTFETGLDGWSHGGTAGFFDRTTTRAHAGTYSVGQSSSVGNLFGSIEKTLTCRAGNITWWAWGDYDVNGGQVAMFIDGVQVTTAGEVWDSQWHQYSKAVSAGLHTVKFQASQDPEYTTEAHVDDISIPVP